MVVNVVLKHRVHLGFDRATLDVHDGHVIDLSGAVDTCIGLQVRFNAGAWSIPNDCVGGS